MTVDPTLPTVSEHSDERGLRLTPEVLVRVSGNHASPGGMNYMSPQKMRQHRISPLPNCGES
jgi:hypothetical protein